MTGRRRIDPLVAAVAEVLSSAPAAAREKAALLLASLDPGDGRFSSLRARGLGQAVRRLRTELPDEDILAGAHNLAIGLGRPGDAQALPEP